MTFRCSAESTAPMLVLDEVQTGMFRTGKFLAAHTFHVEPDMVILAKALSGGLIPVAAVLMTDEINEAVYSSLRRAIVHTSTYGENALAMRAGLATLDVLEDENLGDRATSLGELLRSRLVKALQPYEMFKAAPGLGLLSGIEFRAPSKLTLRLSFEAFRAIHPGMFGQMLVMKTLSPGEDSDPDMWQQLHGAEVGATAHCRRKTNRPVRGVH